MLSRSVSGSHRSRWSIALAGAFISAGLLLGGPAALVQAAHPAATPYGTNLVVNGNAETIIGSEWETFPSGDFRRHKYGSSGLGFPSTSASNAIGGGKRFFYAGPYDETYGSCGDAQQQWKLKGIGAAVDSGHVRVTLRGYAGTNGAADINAHTDLYFRNAENHGVAKNGITKRATSTNEQYHAINVTKTLPTNTRILRVHLWADGDSTQTSGDCQAFWDNISVVLSYV